MAIILMSMFTEETPLKKIFSVSNFFYQKRCHYINIPSRYPLARKISDLLIPFISYTKLLE